MMSIASQVTAGVVVFFSHIFVQIDVEGFEEEWLHCSQKEQEREIRENEKRIAQIRKRIADIDM